MMQAFADLELAEGKEIDAPSGPASLHTIPKCMSSA